MICWDRIELVNLLRMLILDEFYGIFGEFWGVSMRKLYCVVVLFYFLRIFFLVFSLGELI